MGSRGGINGVYNIVIGSAAWIGWNGQFATRTITLALSALADLANDASMVSRSIVITPADVNAHWVSAHVGALYIRIGVPQNIQNQNGTQYFIVGAKDTISMFAYDHFCCSGDAVR